MITVKQQFSKAGFQDTALIRILAHEENQYSNVYKILGQFLSKAFKQTKARPRSSGTPFLVHFIFQIIKCVFYFRLEIVWTIPASTDK